MALTHPLKTKAATCALLLLLAACGGHQQEQQGESEEAKQESSSESSGSGIGDAVKSMKGLSAIADHADDMEKMQNTLKALKPIPNDQLKAALPATLLGIKRSELSVGGNMVMAGLQMGEAAYEKEDGNRIKLSITDGAGETGSGVASLQYMGLLVDSEKETDDGYEKNTDLNGQRVHLEESKNGDQVDSKITFLAHERFLISIEGEGIPESELEKAMKELDLGGLK